MIQHSRIRLAVDFDERRLRGQVEHQLNGAWPGGELVLHGNGLILEEGESGDEKLVIQSRPGTEGQGEWIHVELPEGATAFTLHYQSASGASGLQWLSPAQTAGGKLPFLYTQGQSIHTRSWVPCIDEPAHRQSWELTLELPEGMEAVGAASERRVEGNKAHFTMPHPVPAYLWAFAVGDLARQEFDSRCAVWAEPCTLEAAAYEFAETPQMLEKVETLFGPYRWGRYDLLVLPPSFPIGGMENPCLTFCTPTVLAGDRSLVSLIAHEMAHSWSGNLVTNRSWNDFWINEGFTVYLERRILEAIYGEERAEAEAMVGRIGLEETLAEFGPGHADSHLRLRLGDRHPDEAMSLVPYEKGYLLLRLIEERYGREDFDAWLRSYFGRHAFGSIDCDQLVEEFQEGLFSKHPEIDAPVMVSWLDAPDIPDEAPRAKVASMEKAEALGIAFAQGAKLNREFVTQATTTEWLQFFEALPEILPAEQLAELETVGGMKDCGNYEILVAWLRLAIRSDHAGANGALIELLGRVGRQKFLKPLYQELLRKPARAQEARELYGRFEERYHPMAQRGLRGLFRPAG